MERIPASWRERLALQDFNDRMRLGIGCQDCGWRSWPRGLDWDHVRRRKLAGISEMIANRRPLTLIMIEMEKCDVVCANCHRIRTCNRRQACPPATQAASPLVLNPVAGTATPG